MRDTAVILAHGGAGWIAAWRWDPEWMVPLLLLTAASSYLFGLSRLRSRASRAGPRTRLAWFFGLAVAGAALFGPLDAAAHDLFSAHMIQHLILILVVAPALVAGHPARVLGAAFPVAVRRFSVRSSGHSIARAVRSPIVVGLLTAGVLGAWHIPLLYGAALHSDVVHAAEHGSFVTTGVAFWSFILSRRPVGIRAALMFAVFLFSGALGALLTFSGTVFYPMHARGPAAWGLTPMSDQQLAGVVMWVPSGFIYVLSFVVLFVTWMHRLETRMPSRPPAARGAIDG